MKLNSNTHKPWVMHNEDATPNLVIFDPKTRTNTLYQFAVPPASGGGYDDIAFRNGKAYDFSPRWVFKAPTKVSPPRRTP